MNKTSFRIIAVKSHGEFHLLLRTSSALRLKSKMLYGSTEESEFIKTKSKSRVNLASPEGSDFITKPATKPFVK